MFRWAISVSRTVLLSVTLGALAMAFASTLTTSCRSPNFDFSGGEAGMGGQGPSCLDGVKNHGETDKDCGGECGATCETGKTCLDNDDCLSRHCQNRVCQAPTCDDRISNGDESGIDCGGSCGKCPVGEPCLVATDCQPPPDGDPAAAARRDGVCALACPDDTGDCNARADDGCEVDLLTSMNHCGPCKSACDPPHSAGECIGGECLIKTDEP